MERTKKIAVANKLYIVLRILMVLSFVCMFVPALNPVRVSGMISKTMSLFTSGVSYTGLEDGFGRAIIKGWVEQGTITILYVSSMITCIGIVVMAISGCMSVGELKLKRLGIVFSIFGALVASGSMVGFIVAHNQFLQSKKLEKIEPMFPSGFYVIFAILILCLLLSVIIYTLLPRATEKDTYEMESKYKLFLLFMPFLALIFVFSYLPLLGWRYAFFDYKAGGELTWDKFVAFKWFTYLFENQATRQDIIRVLKNTMAMSFLGIATSWVAMAFAIFLSEIKSNKYRRIVQTLTTIPNFISWVLVYAVAFAIFSTDGFINSLLFADGQGPNYLMSGSYIWIKMLLWGMWKGLGWSAIIYIAAISGIDQQLYEAASIDGAGRFQRMRHITVPGLMPTYCVLLLLSIAGILSNGLDQYLVFKNSVNVNDIQVLDLYVFTLGINKGIIPLSTVIGMVKSVVSVTLLFGANRISKAVRGESIV